MPVESQPGTATSVLLGAGWISLLTCWVTRAHCEWNHGPIGYIYFCPGIAFGVIALFLLLLHIRRRRPILGALALLVVAGPLMGFALPSRNNDGPSPRLRVATANIECWTADPRVVARSLARIDADVLFLQEVWSYQALAALKSELPSYTFHPVGSLTEHSETGLFIATRLPLKEVSLKMLDGAAFVKAKYQGERLTLVVTHGHKQNQGYESFFGIAETIRLQNRQMAEIVSEIRDDPRAILGGDLNAPPSAPSSRTLARYMTDAFAESGAGYGYTFPDDWPLARIDYVYCGKGWRSARCWTVTTGSDHRAVVAELVPLSGGQGH